MYIALCIMLCGIVFGWLTRKIAMFEIIKYLNLPAILTLLFMMGISIGKNREIVDTLAVLGGNALLLTIFGMAGSIFCVCLIRPLVKKSMGKKKDND